MAQDQLSPGRMEAFSDGVIAVIITIMVLELKVPSAHEIPNNLLSFIQTGIYWVNHHYLIDDVDQVSHGILWSNLAFLFTLSLIPFATNWVGERGVTSFSISLYAICCALPALAWIVLSNIICRRTGIPLAGSPVKQVISAVLYLGAIPVSHLSPLAAIGMIVVVAILWLIPPQKVIELTRKPTPPPSR
jgi:uncharacterized membrane protein